MKGVAWNRHDEIFSTYVFHDPFIWYQENKVMLFIGVVYTKQSFGCIFLELFSKFSFVLDNWNYNNFNYFHWSK